MKTTLFFGNPLRRLLVAMFVSVFIVSCGQKGPLYLPNDTPPQKPEKQSPATSPQKMPLNAISPERSQ